MQAKKNLKNKLCLVLTGFLACTVLIGSGVAEAQEKIGVLFIQHGGFEKYSEQNLWEASAHLFAVRPDHPVHKWVLFNSAGWGGILTAGNAPKEIGKYSFEYERLGGTDPFPAIIKDQALLLGQLLNQQSCDDTEYVVDYSGWMNADNIEHFAYPRFLYTAPDYIAPFPMLGQKAETISGLIYCGEDEPGGPWADCDSDRYDVDGPAERFIAAGVDRVIAIDLTTSGVRFFKTYDVLSMFKMALVDNGGASIDVHWINDPNGLMEASLPTAPTGNWGKWTPDRGAPTVDPSVPLEDNPNPIAADNMLATLLVEGAEDSFNSAVSDADTGVLIMNHATGDYAQYFDPKIDDTLVLNQNIKDKLLVSKPGLKSTNIVGAFMGIKEDGTAEGFVGTERTRNMRGENLGHAWLYETSSVPGSYVGAGLLPVPEWGYKYWDALELLIGQGVEHIVIVFPQIVADSVLNLVELHNQIGKEIGYKSWLHWGTGDDVNYPDVGHPFADYWGIWVDTECDDGAGGVEDCCFEMGGCADGRPYPPPRQTAAAREDLDPSLAYDVSEYGHLGYNPVAGAPDSNSPVQDQYTGTWAFYRPPNKDARLVQMLADHVLEAAGCPTLITLSDFSATAGSRKVILNWSTSSEIDNAGFNLYRAEAGTEGY
ncbi:MAG: hypothetical protein GY850_27945, partial [bacterium]|nr:hypothetical protein [bacterium]